MYTKTRTRWGYNVWVNANRLGYQGASKVQAGRILREKRGSYRGVALGPGSILPVGTHASTHAAALAVLQSLSAIGALRP